MQYDCRLTIERLAFCLNHFDNLAKTYEAILFHHINVPTALWCRISRKLGIGWNLLRFDGETIFGVLSTMEA